jgi:SAM-dependent methyltransferase
MSGNPSRPPSAETPAPLASSYWDEISDRIFENYYHDAVIGQLKRDAHLRLITRWCGDLRGKTVLKTDLFEEAHGTDQFLFELEVPGGLRLGMDLSPVIVRRARQAAPTRGLASCALVAGDVLAIPFREDSLDVVVSNSTLDHFPRPQYIEAALRQLLLVLKPGGTLIVTLDNPHSLSYFVGRFKRLVRPAPFFLGHTLSVRELTAMLVGIGYRVTDTTAILHGLENHSSAAMQLARRLGGPLHAAIRTVLVVLERLEAAPTRYLTGAFIAARAVKPENAGPRPNSTMSVATRVNDAAPAAQLEHPQPTASSVARLLQWPERPPVLRPHHGQEPA